MAYTSGTLIGLDRKAGADDRGLSVFEAATVQVPIACELIEPSARTLATLRAADLVADRVMIVMARSLAAQGLALSVGDRVRVHPRGRSAEAFVADVVARRERDHGRMLELSLFTVTIVTGEEDA